MIAARRDIAFVDFADEASSTLAREGLNNFKMGPGEGEAMRVCFSLSQMEMRRRLVPTKHDSNRVYFLSRLLSQGSKKGVLWEAMCVYYIGIATWTSLLLGETTLIPVRRWSGP